MQNKPIVDFATLTLMDALDLGILIEEDAAERYQEFVEQLATHHTTSAGKFFQEMVRNENKHRDWLTGRRQELFGDTPSRVNANMLVEIEAPAYREAGAFMSLRQALDVAMKAERRAEAFFADALKHARDPEVRALFEELRQEEVEHQAMVQAEIDKLPDRPDPDPEPHVDEPIGQ